MNAGQSYNRQQQSPERSNSKASKKTITACKNLLELPMSLRPHGDQFATFSGRPIAASSRIKQRILVCSDCSPRASTFRAGVILSEWQYNKLRRVLCLFQGASMHREYRDTLAIDRLLTASVLIVALAVVQFGAFTYLAMKNYDVSNHPNGPSTGYIWSKNFLSDLGLQRTTSGANNSFSAACFNRSIILLGISLAGFFIVSVKASAEVDMAAIIIAVSGAISSLGLVGIGLTPYDRFFVLHHLMLATWILPLPVIAITFSFQCFRSENRLGKIFGTVGSLAAAGLIVAIIAFAGAGSYQGFVVRQKLLVGVSLIWFAIILARVALSAVIIVKHRQRRDDQLAEQYLRQLDKSKQYLKPYRRYD
jgi:hypothetical membrane protein